jgi:hypothetical protein
MQFTIGQTAMGWRRTLAAVAATCLLAAATTSDALAQSGAFAGLGGSWSGSGQIRLEGGQREAIRCSANYVSRSGGSGLGLSLRCASPSGRVELRASLTASGGRVSGSWEERTYGLAGSVSGSGSGNSLRLAFSGSVSGSMSVSTSGGSQSISVRTASALQSVSVSLRRN